MRVKKVRGEAKANIAGEREAGRAPAADRFVHIAGEEESEQSEVHPPPLSLAQILRNFLILS